MCLSASAFGCSEPYVIARAADAGEPVEACLLYETCDTALPELEDVQVTMRGSTAIIEFSPFAPAVDYRVYALPEPTAVSRADDGRQVVRDAVYRCAGKRTVAARTDQYGALYSLSLTGNDNGYARSEAESTLGFVFRAPAPGRVAVHRMADPNGSGGYFNAEWIAPLYREANSAEYVNDATRRQQLLAQGFRDDGIAFYAPIDGDVSVYRMAYAPDAHQGARVSLYFTDGPEHDTRTTASQDSVIDLAERFRVLSMPTAQTVALRRVTYHGGSVFDVLAAGDGMFERTLEQAGPVTSLTWSGITDTSTLVIEALDEGCPFPNAYVGAFAAAADVLMSAASYASETLDALRSADTGEVFVNAQHDHDNRPNAIARSFVDVEPQARPAMDFEAAFDDPDQLRDMTRHEDANDIVYRNAHWSIETSHCNRNFTYGAVLGQLFLGVPECRLSVVPRGFQPRLSADRFLHARLSVDLPSTARRYPQLLITTTPMLEAEATLPVSQLPLHNRLGPVTSAELPGTQSSIVVQPFFSYQELQIQLCDHRGWGTTAPCPRANIYGFNVGTGEASDQWRDERWLPVPVVADRVGFDRPVQLDVYASTQRVYLFMDDQPVGCAVLTEGAMPAGDVTVALRAIVDEAEKDELIDMEPGRSFERELSVGHSDRRVDAFAIDLDVSAPAWDETRLPCATRYYGGVLQD